MTAGSVKAAHWLALGIHGTLLLVGLCLGYIWLVAWTALMVGWYGAKAVMQIQLAKPPESRSIGFEARTSSDPTDVFGYVVFGDQRFPVSYFSLEPLKPPIDGRDANR